MDYTQKYFPQENEHLEYKKGRNAFPKEAWKSISAFQNTDGGTLILGVDEIEGHRFVKNGVQNAQKILDDFWSSVSNPEKISYNTIQNSHVQIHKEDETVLIEINIPEAPDTKKPVYIGNDVRQTFIRNGATDVKAIGDNLKTLLRSAEDNLDTNVLKNYDIDDLDMASIEQYKQELIVRKNYEHYKELDLPIFLERIGVISKDYKNDGKKGITSAGLLFFGKNNAILHTFPNFQLDYFDKSHPDQERWSERVSSIEQDLNIYSFFKKVDRILSESLANPFVLDDDGQRVDSFGTMFVAVREGLINMLMHADYFESEPLVLNNFTNYFEFINPGKMKVPSDSFFTTNQSKNRNSIISKLFLQVGYGERAGHGGETIFESAVMNKVRYPEIKTNFQDTQLKIWKVDYATSFSGKVVNPRERTVLKAIVSSQNWSLSHKEIEQITSLSRTITSTTLSKLIEKGLIVKLGKGRSTRYSLESTNEQVLAQAQIMPDMLRATMKAMRQYKNKKS